MRAAALALACACAAPSPAPAPIRSGVTGAEPPSEPTAECVRAFIDAQPLAAPRTAPDLYRVPKQGSGPHYYVFDVEYGAPISCRDCNQSYAHGIALSCDHIGWYRVEDNTDKPAKLTKFDVRPGDLILFDTSLWGDATQPEFILWLEDDPGVPPAVQKQARDRQPEIYF
jgi:hypothetical protein